MPRMLVPYRLLAGWNRAIRITSVGALASEFVLDCPLYCRLLHGLPESSTRTDDQNVPYFVLLSLSSLNFCFFGAGSFFVSMTRATQEVCGSAVFAV